MAYTNFPRLTLAKIDSIDVTSYVFAWKVDREFGEAISKCNLVLKNSVTDTGLIFDELNSAHTIEIWRGATTTTDTKIFKGESIKVVKDGVNIALECNDMFYQAVTSEVTKSFDKDIDTEAGVVSEIFSTLINDYALLTADSSSVQNSGTINVLKKFICNHAQVFERCEKLGELLDWQMYYNPVDDKIYFEEKGTPFNSEVLEVGKNIISQPKWDIDNRQLCNKLTIIGGEEIVETTESGQIGVTSGYTTSSIALSNTPYSVKVYCDAANPPTTLKTGGNDSVTTYDYSVDVENKKVVWNTDQFTPGGSDYVEVRYSYKVPRPVLASNAASITTHGLKRKSFFKSELKDISDVGEYASKYILRYKDPFFSTNLHVLNVSDMYPGQTIRVIDSEQSISRTFLINKLTMSYPYKYDNVIISDKKLRTSSWGAKTSDRIGRLEEELGRSQDILTHLIDFSRSFKYKRRYMRMQKKTYPNPSTDVFILGNSLYGVLGTNKLGDSTGVAYADVRVTQGQNKYIELFYDDTFEASATTATWNTGNQRIDFTAGQIAQTEPIFYDAASTDTVSAATLTTTYTGTLTLEMSADGGSNWESVTSGVAHTFNNTGSDLRVRITESGAAVAQLTALEVAYTLA